jgi:hypothetical protein
MSRNWSDDEIDAGLIGANEDLKCILCSKPVGDAKLVNGIRVNVCKSCIELRASTLPSTSASESGPVSEPPPVPEYVPIDSRPANFQSPRKDHRTSLSCSFCGKSQRDVKKLIAGPGVCICDECTGLCSEIFAEEIRRTDESTDDSKTAELLRSMAECCSQAVTRQQSGELSEKLLEPLFESVRAVRDELTKRGG